MNIPTAESLQQSKYVDYRIYHPVLSKCIERIVHASKTSEKSWIVFEVPSFLLGVPQYNISICIYYLSTELAKKNYLTTFINPVYIHIDWGKKSKLDKNSKYIKKILDKHPDSKIEFIYKNV